MTSQEMGKTILIFKSFFFHLKIVTTEHINVLKFLVGEVHTLSGNYCYCRFIKCIKYLAFQRIHVV